MQALLLLVLLSAEPLRPVVEVEEEVYRYAPANNGAGPMWAHGSTCLARIGDDVFASGLETLAGAKPLNNCRWLLYRREAKGWALQQADSGRTREPCPLACFPGGPLLLSANPTLVGSEVAAGPARPEVLAFDPKQPKAPGRALLPAWEGKPTFNEHSYRSFAADGPRREAIVLQNVGYAHAEWAFYDREGKWSAQGKLVWPFGKEYERPQPIRLCYPTVALRDRAVHFCGVSDIEEPNSAWREHKRRLTGRAWDYDFRRLFYAWSRDIGSRKFEPWVEIASRDKTGGWIMPADLWLAPDGAAHLLWTERAIDDRLRAKFFPEAKQSFALNYALVREGKVVSRRTLLEAAEGGPQQIPAEARFQPAPDGRLAVFCFVHGARQGRSIAENRVFELCDDGSPGPQVRVPLARPLASFCTATPRAGSPPATTIDLLGESNEVAATVRYARVRLR